MNETKSLKSQFEQLLTEEVPNVSVEIEAIELGQLATVTGGGETPAATAEGIAAYHR